jgi:two-component system sensor histidine kinase QseC
VKRSIHHQLFRQLLLGMLMACTVAGLLLYGYVRSEFMEQFDDDLALKARSLASLIKRNPEGQAELDFADEVMPEFAAGHHVQYYEVWLPDGTPLERSPSLASHDLPRRVAPSHSPIFKNVRLPNGRAGRAIFMTIIPPLKMGAEKDKATPLPAAPLQLSVARDREELDESLVSLITALIITAFLMSAAIPLIVLLIVRRGLAPLNEVARYASEIDATTLATRFPTRDLPAEMTPICAKLNDLLDRLDEAFQRERRFTANAAHELRTPIAELRALSEVALRSRPEAMNTTACFQDALNIALQMERLIAMLLALARGHSRESRMIDESCDLVKLVADVWKPLNAAAARRALRVNMCLPPSATVHCNPVMLSVILRNVLSNAVDYTPPGGDIICRLESTSSGGWTLDVQNSNDTLTPTDLPHLGEPFWRHAADRSDQGHAGLGLALICTYCALLGIDLNTELVTPKCFRLVLALGRPAVHGDPA